MGYANPGQISEGIHLRQFSRAFIVRDPDTKTSVVYVNIDACMLSQVVKLEVTGTYNSMTVEQTGAATWQNQQNYMCTQQRLRSAWAAAQSDQSLHCPREETLGL